MVTKPEIEALKRRVGRKPFDERLKFSNDSAKCPFHNGDSEKSMHLKQVGDVFIATCFSGCSKSWDAISFVKDYDHVAFPEALARLGGKAARPISDEPPRAALSEEAWLSMSTELTSDDIDRFAKKRKDATASLETFQSLGCRKIGNNIAFPHKYTDSDGVHFNLVKCRGLDEKKFESKHDVKADGFFNLDTINVLEPVHIVEGESDVAIMEQHGFRAVCGKSGSQKKFNPEQLEYLKVAPAIYLMGDQKKSADNGDPGQAHMDALQKLLPVEKTFRMYFEAHDACALASACGADFRDRILELQQDAQKSWVSRNIPSIGELVINPNRWLIENVIPLGGLTVLSGAMGSQKSLLAMAVGRALSFGHNEFLGRPLLHDISGGYIGSEGLVPGKFPRGVPVLYLDRENPPALIDERRRAFGMLANKNFRYWSDAENEATPDIDDPRLIEFASRDKGFIILDSFQDWLSASENDTQEMVKMLHRLMHLARLGSGVLFLHHDLKQTFDKKGKPNRTAGYRGSTPIVNLSDMAMVVRKDWDPHTKEGTNELQIRELRFRMCAGWEIDCKFHFQNATGTTRKNFVLELLRDQLSADASADRKELKDEKIKAKDKKDEQDTARLSGMISEDRMRSPRKLRSETGMNQNRINKLTTDAGWQWDKEQGCWLLGTQETFGTVPPII